MLGFRFLMIMLVAMTLFIGGIILLLAKLPFWSYYFGIPSVQIGIIFLILSFERLMRGPFGRSSGKNIGEDGSINLIA
ncbi:hypothetical protein HYW46_04685 [Candidatus Daviesbacteria bacterium]|nr:hypothetical protein [Candidatus Daviesbacteria bacterium]